MSKIDAIIKSHGQSTDGWEGSDACLETSLLEYQLIWRVSDGHVRFIFTAPYWSGDEDDVFTDWAEYPADTNTEREWDWALSESFFNSLGMSRDEFRGVPFPYQVRDLVNYHGVLEIFGESPFPVRTTFSEEED
jgi:hypothetical protein